MSAAAVEINTRIAFVVMGYVRPSRPRVGMTYTRRASTYHTCLMIQLVCGLVRGRAGASSMHHKTKKTWL